MRSRCFYFSPEGRCKVNHGSNTTLSLRGVFVPLWLLARPEVEHGAKLAYVLLAQKAGVRGAANVYVPALSAELGDEEGNVGEFLTALESCGLIRIQSRHAESGVLHCVFPSHPWAGGNGTSELRGGGDGKYSGPPKSRHSRDDCVRFATAKREAGQKIRNVHALANHFYQTGLYDEELDLFVSRGGMIDTPLDELTDVQ